MTYSRHPAVPGRRSVGVCTLWTGTARFLFKIKIEGFQRRLVVHRTRSVKCRNLKKYLNKSVFARPGIGRCPSYHRTVHVRRCKRSTGRRTMNTLISKFATIPPKKLIVKVRKIEVDSDRDWGKNHTCSWLQKILIALVRCMLIILSCLSEIYIFVLM